MKIGNTEFKTVPIILAPMEGVTDPVFRKICKGFGADWVYTEFVSSEALIRDVEESQTKSGVYENERPISVQIFGHSKDSLVKAAAVVAEKQPDFIDINCGCPVRKVVRNGAGAALLKEPDKMVELIEAVVKSTNIPVTVKTRIGWDQGSIDIVNLSEKIQDIGVAAIGLHARTAKQMYKGQADWTWLSKVKENPRFNIPLLGNGDVKTAEDAVRMKNDCGVDGIMIGRGTYGNPWLIQQAKTLLTEGIVSPAPSIEERINVCEKHLLDSIEYKGDRAIVEIRKHYANYFKALFEFKPFKVRLIKATELEEVLNILEEIRKVYVGL